MERPDSHERKTSLLGTKCIRSLFLFILYQNRPCNVYVPELIASLWKEAFQAHYRIYPLRTKFYKTY